MESVPDQPQQEPQSPVPNTQPRVSFEALRAARLAAIQAIYQHGYTDAPLEQIVEEFMHHRLPSDDYPTAPDPEFFKLLMTKIHERKDELMTIINAHLTLPWTFDTLQPVLRAIVQAGVLELLEPLTKAPVPVIIMEYVDLTQGFFSNTEAKLTNAVLDSVAKVLGLKLKK